MWFVYILAMNRFTLKSDTIPFIQNSFTKFYTDIKVSFGQDINNEGVGYLLLSWTVFVFTMEPLKEAEENECEDNTLIHKLRKS